MGICVCMCVCACLRVKREILNAAQNLDQYSTLPNHKG